MNRIDVSVRPYELKFKVPFETSKGIINSRKGFIIKFRNSSGKSGSGDICPFPEFGTETYAEASGFLQKFNMNLSFDPDDPAKSYAHMFEPIRNLPSTCCGIEQAFLMLAAGESSSSLNHLLNRKSNPCIKVNAVIGFMSPADCARTAEKLIKEGFTTLKIKAGRDYFKEDLECIKSISSAVPENTKLRIDVNGKWNSVGAIRNLNDLDDFNIEYVEEPVHGLDEFVKISTKCTIPLAADESVRNLADAVNLIKSGAVNYLILKPMILGGIIPLTSIYDEAQKNKIKTVVTSSFESAVGRAYAVFASSLIEEDIAHGLATGDYFENEIFNDPYPVKNGVINL